jgi:hypothetical protein
MSSGNPDNEPGQKPASFVRALITLCRPLVKLLLKRGVTLPEFNQLLKKLYIDIAESEFQLPNKRQTDSRIHLLTGIHRKDVKKLRESQETEQDTVPQSVSLGGLLVSRWTALPEYLDSDNNPLPLPRHSDEQTKISFESLVRSVNKDIRPRVILDEWLHMGIVRINDDDLIELNTRAFVPEKGFDELAYYFGRNLSDHVAAAAHNLSDTDKRFLERSVYYEKLSKESVDKLDKMSRDLGMQALQSINKEALKLQTVDEKKDIEFQRINFGVYFYSTNNETENKSGQSDENEK